MTDCQSELADTAGNTFTSTILYGWLDEAQKAWATELYPALLRVRNFVSVSQYQDRFQVPTDRIALEGLVTRRTLVRKLKWVNPTDYMNQQTSVNNAISNDPVIWTEMDGGIYIWPRYGGTSLLTTAGSFASAAATSINIATTSQLRTYGRVKIGSEEIEYTDIAGSTIHGCTRGLNQTTAASISTGATVTQLDLEIDYVRHPVALASTASPEIDTAFHQYLKLYVKYLAYMQEGSYERANEMMGLWKEALEKARYSQERQGTGPLHLRDIETQSIQNLFGPV